jgi:hypothetical protein
MEKRLHKVVVSGLLSLAVMMPACGGAADETAAPAAAPAAGEHAHTAPHGGTLVELGDHLASLEVVHTPATGMLVIYVLDGEAEGAVRIAQTSLMVHIEGDSPRTVELVPVASALTGETLGDASQFSHTSDQLKGAITQVRVQEIVVKGQTFRDVSVNLAR